MLLKRLAFFGGKGGVGKSTLSCATALKLSEKEKTLLVSVDPAHSLSGILGIQVGPSVKNLKENFFAVELDAGMLVEEYANKVISSLANLLPNVRSGIKEYTRYLKNSPTALETAVLDRLLDYCMDFSYVVVDSAPTGQMLRLFETAHMVSQWFEFLRRMAKEKAKVEAFMGRQDELLKLIDQRKSRIGTLLNVFKEGSIVFAVANEEPLSLQEAREIGKKLKDMKVHLVINHWKSMKCDCIRIPEYERPYGIELIKGINVEEIVSHLLQ